MPRNQTTATRMSRQYDIVATSFLRNPTLSVDWLRNIHNTRSHRLPSSYPQDECSTSDDRHVHGGGGRGDGRESRRPAGRHAGRRRQAGTGGGGRSRPASRRAACNGRRTLKSVKSEQLIVQAYFALKSVSFTPKSYKLAGLLCPLPPVPSPYLIPCSIYLPAKFPPHLE